MNSKKTYSFDEAQILLENYCAYQERCHKEVTDKLKNMRMIPEAIDNIIVHLIQHNYLNEERFALAFVSGKVNIKRWGRIKIRQHLKQKRISDYSTKKGLESISEEDYYKNATDLAEKKLNSLSREKGGYAKKVKVYRFLSSKGYETDVIREIVDPLFT